nr:chemotaxis protein CheW [Flocculibacter collagenilyticus]
MMEEEEYGVDILSVQEIRGWEEVTVIPNAPAFVKGVINLRGTIVPLIDLRARFSLATKPYTALTVVVVIKVEFELDNKIMGIVVDAVSDVYSIDDASISQAPSSGDNANHRYIKGLVNVEGQMVSLLNLTKLLNLEIS